MLTWLTSSSQLRARVLKAKALRFHLQWVWLCKRRLLKVQSNFPGSPAASLSLGMKEACHNLQGILYDFVGYGKICHWQKSVLVTTVWDCSEADSLRLSALQSTWDRLFSRFEVYWIAALGKKNTARSYLSLLFRKGLKTLRNRESMGGFIFFISLRDLRFKGDCNVVSKIEIQGIFSELTRRPPLSQNQLACVTFKCTVPRLQDN